MQSPPHIEIWDWKLGKCVRTLTGFGGTCVRGHSRHPDGRLVAADDAGTIRVGMIDDWGRATSISNGQSLVGVLVDQDGSIVTTDTGGNVKLWRNGACEIKLSGGSTRTYTGVPLAVIFGRLIVTGDNKNLLVSD